MATAQRNLTEEEENVVEALDHTIFTAIAKLEVGMLLYYNSNSYI